jgi:lysozyme
METVQVLKRDEGFRGYPYDDADGRRVGGRTGKRHIDGNLTIGYGWNLETTPLPQDVAELLLERQVRAIRDAFQSYEWYRSLSPVRKTVIECMAYQMGVEGVLKFKKTIERIVSAQRFIRQGAWKEVAEEMLRSKWAIEDSPARARRYAKVMETNNPDYFV